MHYVILSGEERGHCVLYSVLFAPGREMIACPKNKKNPKYMRLRQIQNAAHGP